MLYELPDFEYFEPESVEDAISILDEYKGSAKILAGGTDLLGLLKDRISGSKMPIPSAIVNIKKIAELRRVAHDETESFVGSTMTLSEIASEPVLNKRFPGFAQAASSVATNQIRNMGTLGGNLCQRPWCWYFRHPTFDCFKKGGKQCYAITGDNSTYFSIFNLGTCVMAHPSDTAPALMSLDAIVEIAGKEGIREVGLSDFFLGPKNVEENILRQQEILLGVRIPNKPNQRCTYMKHRIRRNWDFALASVAASGSSDLDGNIESARVVLGGVAPLPIELRNVQETLHGKRIGDDKARQEISTLIVNLAKPLKMNHYKVRIVRTLVSRALDSIFRK